MPPAEELYSQNLALKAKVEDLEAQLAWFRRQVFAGSKTERLVVDAPAQIKLGLP